MYFSLSGLQLTFATLQTQLPGSLVLVFKMFSVHHKIAVF